MVPLDRSLRDLSESHIIFSFYSAKYNVISKVPFMKLKNNQIYNNWNIFKNKKQLIPFFNTGFVEN